MIETEDNAMEDLYYWEQHAHLFDAMIGEEGDLLRREILDPFLIEQIAPAKSDIILDAGCGNGYFARKLAPLVKHVYAVDGSEKMIEIAKNKTKGETKDPSNITYHVQDLTKTSWNIKEKCNHIIAHLVLQDLDPFENVIQECARHLTEAGFIHVTIPHPFTSPPVGRYVFGLSGRLGISKGHLKVYNYNEERKTERDIYLHKQIKHNYYHRTISTYINTLIHQNFQIDAVHEIGTDTAFTEKNPEYAHGRAIPIFLYLKAKKT